MNILVFYFVLDPWTWLEYKNAKHDVGIHTVVLELIESPEIDSTWPISNLVYFDG